MATEKPRVYMTLDPSHHAVLRETAELTDDSMSSVIRRIVELAAPTYARINRAVRMVENGKQHEFDFLRMALERTEDSMREVFGNAWGIDLSDFGPRPSNTGALGFSLDDPDPDPDPDGNIPLRISTELFDRLQAAADESGLSVDELVSSYLRKQLA